MMRLMKKEIIISTLFAIMLAMSVVNVKYLEKITSYVSRHAEAAADAMAEGDTQGAEAHAVEAFRLWQSKDLYARIMLQHTVYENGESALIMLLTEIYSENAGGVLGAAEAVRRSMESIMGSERIRLGSIF